MWVEGMNAKYGNTATKILTVLLVLAMILVAGESVQFVSTVEEHSRKTFQKDGSEITIVVDAGHGGSIRARSVSTMPWKKISTSRSRESSSAISGRTASMSS